MSFSARDFSGHPMRGFAFKATLLIALVAFVHFGEKLVSSAVATSPPLDVPYVPTPQNVVDRMLEIAEVGPDDYVIDLGSGDGRIVITAVRDWDARAAHGIDIDPERIAEAQANAREAGVENRVTFTQGDLFEMDLSEATVLTMYLLQGVNHRLRPVILEAMEPGTRVVSHAFDMGDWRPDLHNTVEGRNVYLWVVPAQVAGRWTLTTGDEEELSLFLNQNYQELEGNAVTNNNSTKLTDTSLQGDRIDFTINDTVYKGTVEGDSIVPIHGSDNQDWHAQRP